jgi:dual specificity phosphatase 12
LPGKSAACAAKLTVSYPAIEELRRLRRLAFTHLLSVVRHDFAAEAAAVAPFAHLVVAVDDEEAEDLLCRLPQTNAFIGGALASGGRVLVHCVAGTSRSVAVVAAYLMAAHDMDSQGALALVRAAHPPAAPNPSFVRQLELYAAMGRPVDVEGHALYQQWRYALGVERSVAAGRAPDVLRFEDEETTTTAATTTAGELRCRRCRRVLATAQPHRPAARHRPACAHHFVQPQAWMRPELERGQLEGRLACPNARCGALVGRYAWQGMRCSCGDWLVPGFSLQAARVDRRARQMAEAGQT